MGTEDAPDTSWVLELYREHGEALRAVRAQMRRLCRTRCVPWRNRSPLHKVAARMARVAADLRPHPRKRCEPGDLLPP